MVAADARPGGLDSREIYRANGTFLHSHSSNPKCRRREE